MSQADTTATQTTETTAASTEVPENTTLATSGENASTETAQSETMSETLLTGQDAPKGEEEAKPQEGEPNKEGKEGEQEPVIPDTAEGYDLSFDEGVNVDKGLLANFQQAALDQGLSVEQAQAFATLYAGHVQEQEKAVQQALTATQKEWEAEIMESPTFKADVEAARKTLVQFGSFGHVNDQGNPVLHPELKEIFDETMIGSHPKVFQMFVAIGKALGEPGFQGTSGTGTEASAAKVLYPDMN